MPTIAYDDDRNISRRSIALEAEGYRIMTYTTRPPRSTASSRRAGPRILEIRCAHGGWSFARGARRDMRVIVLHLQDEEIDELSPQDGRRRFIRKSSRRASWSSAEGRTPARRTKDATARRKSMGQGARARPLRRITN